MPETPKGFRYPPLDGSEANNIPVKIKRLADDIEARVSAAMTSAARDALTGSALWHGRTIWNDTTGRRERYDALANPPVWKSEAGATTAAAVSYAGSTDLAATNVEDALDELDAEKISIAAASAAYVAKAGGSTIVPSAAGVVGLGLTAATGQTADLLPVRNAAGVLALRVGPAGELATGGLNAAGSGATVVLGTTDAAVKPLVVQGAPGQTANFVDVQNSSGGRVLQVVAAGGAAETHLIAEFVGIGPRRMIAGPVDSAGVGFRTVRIAN